MRFMSSNDELPAHFWAKVDWSTTRCWLWTAFINKRGYGKFTVRIDGKKGTRCAHRLTYEHFVEPIPDRLQLRHRCGVTSCCNPLHWYLPRMATSSDELPARFWDNVETSTSRCWLWNGGLDKDGYGYYSLAGKRRITHRVAFEHFVGAVPEGLDLDHLCRIRNCCNPLHLEAVTPAVNSGRPPIPQARCPPTTVAGLTITSRGAAASVAGADASGTRTDAEARYSRRPGPCGP